MAEDRTFQDLLVEQKLSNVLLRQLNKEITDLDDITPIESFKHNLAEIVNERLLVKKQLEESKKQAKHEEAEAKKLFREQEKTTQNTTLTKKYTTSLLNWTKKSFLADKARAVKNYVVDEEYRKDQNARMRSYFKGLSDSIVKPFKALKNFFGALLKKGIGPFTIGRLLGLAAIFSVIKFLNSPQWDQFKEEKLIPFLSKAAEALFGENGWFNQLYTLIMGDPNDDSKKGLVGHLAYIVGSFAGLTGESGWEAIADSVKALGRLIFGGEKSKTYGKSGEDTSLLGRIFSLSNVIKVVASGLALAWLIPFLGPVAGISIVALAAAFGFDKIREAFIALRDVIEEMTGVEGVGSWAIAGGLALGALYAFNKALMFGIRSLNPFAGAGGALRAGAGGAMTASNIKAGALDTSTLKKGQKIQLKSGGTAIWRGSQFTSGETGKILATKDVMAQAKLPGKGVMGRLMQVSKFLGQIPYLKTLFTGGMILHALMSGKPVEKMIPDIAGVFGGVGTAMLGALLGGLVGLPGGPLAFVSSLLGGGLGYFLGDATATAFAQWLLGEPIDAFPEWTGLNKLLNAGVGASLGGVNATDSGGDIGDLFTMGDTGGTVSGQSLNNLPTNNTVPTMLSGTSVQSYSDRGNAGGNTFTQINQNNPLTKFMSSQQRGNKNNSINENIFAMAYS